MVSGGLKVGNNGFMEKIMKMGVKPFWGWTFFNGGILDGRYARGWTKEEAYEDAKTKYGDDVDPDSVLEWDGVL